MWHRWSRRSGSSAARTVRQAIKHPPETFRLVRLLVRHPPFLELSGAGCVFSVPGLPQYPPRRSWAISALSEAAVVAARGRFGFSPRSGEKRGRRMPCTGLPRGPATSSTPGFGQMQDQGLQILWFQTRKESDRAIRFPLRITLGWSCLVGPPLLLSQRFSIAAYRHVTRQWTPKPLQWSGSSPRTHNPGTEGDRRGPVRHHRRRLEPNAGGGESGTAQEGQTEGAVEPCQDGNSKANTKRRESTRNRFPNYQKVRKTREPVGFNKYNHLACGKPTGSRFPPIYARAGTSFGNRFAFRHQGGAETGKQKAPAGANCNAQSGERLPGRQPYRRAPLREDPTKWRHAQTVRLIE